MAERNIKILVRDKKALVEGGPVIVCGNSDYTITFDFDNDWNPGGVRTARFVYMRDGKVQHQDVVFEGTTVSVPVLSGITSVKVGVFEGDLSTTTPARISCEGSILCGTGTPEEPTQDVYDQIMALFDSLAGQGSFGATEAQARQIEENKANIEKLETGETKAGDTKKLGGQTAEEWQEVIAAKVESEDALEFGGASGPEFTDTPETIMAALREMDEELDAMDEELDAMREELDALGEAGGGTGGGASTAEEVAYENEAAADVTNVKEALDTLFEGAGQEGGDANPASRGAVSQPGWYRIAEYRVFLASSTLYRLKGADAQSCTINIKRVYNSTKNETYQLRCICAYDTQEFVLLDGVSVNQYFTKIRYAYNENERKGYIEAFYNSSSSELVAIEVQSPNGYGGKWVAIEPTLTEETVEGVTVTTTYDIPAKALPLTTGNKSRGTYTGDGTSTKREIQVGGVGYCLLITSYEGMSIVTRHGGIGKEAKGTSVSGFTSSSCSLADGVCTLATTDKLLNLSGVNYTYQLL